MKTKIFTVRVTREDILLGIRNECYYCPVALALGRELDDARAYIWLTGCDRKTRVRFEMRTPSIVFDWMGDFDLGRRVKPFSFEFAGVASNSMKE